MSKRNTVRVVRHVGVGDRISSDELKRTMWKRGTIIRDSFGHAFSLTADGEWFNAQSGRTWGFEWFVQEKLTVIHLPVDDKVVNVR